MHPAALKKEPSFTLKPLSLHFKNKKDGSK